MKNYLTKSIFIIVMFSNVSELMAATKTWDGGGANDNWTTAANWDADVAPSAGDELVFAGSTRTTPSNDFAAATNFASITFSVGASAFTLSGNSVTITGGATAIAANNTSLTMTINNNIIFSTAAPFITSTSGGTLAIGGTIDNGTLRVTVTGDGITTISSVISGAEALTKAGTGSLTLSGANTFTLGVNLNAGTLKIGNASALGTTAGTFAIAAGTTIDNSSGGLLTLSNYPMEWNGSFTFTGTNSLNMGSGAVTLGANITVTCSSSNLTIGGIISGAFNITRVGTNGHLLLTNSASTYTGTTSSGSNTIGAIYFNVIKNVSGGASSLGAPTSVANGTIALGATTSPGKLIFQGTSDNSTDRVIDLASTTGQVDLKADGTGATITYTSNITVTGNGNKTLLLRGTNTGDNTISGVIPDGGSTTSLAKSESGTWVLSGVNTYTGTTTFTGGVLKLGAAGVIPNASNVVMNGGTLNVNGYSETAGTLTLNANSTIALGSGDHTLTFAASDGTSWTADKLLRITGWIGGYNSTAAGGSDPKVFSGSSAELSAGKLAQIFFSHPISNLPYTATQLASGEIVPTGTLPVELIHFSGEGFSGFNRLYWSTASEINSDHFKILRSSDGVYFEELAIINAAGSSNEFLHYSFEDKLYKSGVNYYQLVEVDNDGSLQESSIISIHNGAEETNQLSVYPNPCINKITVGFTSEEKGFFDLKIYDIRGEQVYQAMIAVSEKENKFNMNFPDLPEGDYIIELLSPTHQSLCSKVIKINR